MPEDKVGPLPRERLSVDELAEREKILQMCCGMSALQAREFAGKLSDEKLVELVNGIGNDMLGTGMKRPATYPENFYGKFYTIEAGMLRAASAWKDLRQRILESLASDQSKRIRQLLEFLLSQPNHEADFTAFKAKFAKSRNALDVLLGYGLVKKVAVKDTTKYSLYAEITPLLKEVLASAEASQIPVVRSEIAQEELAAIEKMEEEFETYLQELLADRWDETLEFGKTLTVGKIADYLQEMFGPTLYFDVLLALAQQYGMTDTPIINPDGGLAMKTGFHLALFGSPGTGKTFAVKDLMLGDPGKGVKAHGLVGLNRYCGGMTAAMFIRVAEAYQGKRFNFVVTEFNDWFRYKGMVEPLKIALEQGEIRYETKTETVGPYRFSSFFATNYNTKVEGPNTYRVTIADPNFNAIEDRMIVRMHRMTRGRLKELTRSQKELAMGRIRMHVANAIRDHLVLVYAIQTDHELVRGKFQKKQVVIRDEHFGKLDEATNLILDQVKGPIQFSARVHRNAIKLAAALSLSSFFMTEDERIEITPEAFNFALKFFVEEVAVRQKVDIDIESVLHRLGISEVARILEKVSATKQALAACNEETRGDEFAARVDAALAFFKKDIVGDERFDEVVGLLQTDVGGGWANLHDDSKQFLVTAEILAHTLSGIECGDLDFAPVVVEYGKYLENEIVHKIFQPYKQSVQERQIQNDDEFFALKPDCLPGSPSRRRSIEKTLESFAAYLRDRTEITLGSMLFIFMNSTEEACDASRLFADFRAFLETKRLSPLVLSSDFLNRLREFTQNHRNKAAHVTALTKTDSDLCRSFFRTGEPSLLQSLSNFGLSIP